MKIKSQGTAGEELEEWIQASGSGRPSSAWWRVKEEGKWQTFVCPVESKKKEWQTFVCPVESKKKKEEKRVWKNCIPDMSGMTHATGR